MRIFVENMENGNKGRWTYLLPPAITLVIYSIILAVKGIYPFGGNTIDYYDMAQQIAAFYYHVYDALHGTKGFFYDWYTALGVNMAMSTSGCSNISPFNLFFLLIRRSSLLKSLSVFNGIKLMCMSFTMYFYLRRTHEKTPEFFRVAASAGYSFCGFVLVLYITNQWVDIAVMFPLIMYFYDRLMKTGKMAGYVITLAITLIASYYLGFMILIFIFLYTGLMLAEEKILPGRAVGAGKGSGRPENENGAGKAENETAADEADDQGALDKQEEHGKDRLEQISGDKESTGRRGTCLHITELGIGTVLSLVLSSFIIIPQLTQMLGSARFHNGNGSESTGMIGKYLEILSHVKGDYTTRWWSLLGISFMSAVIATGLIFCIRRRLIGRGAAETETGGGAAETETGGKPGETENNGKPDETEDNGKPDETEDNGKPAKTETNGKSAEIKNGFGMTMTDILRYRPVLTTVLLILMMVLELFFESINLIWHFGSYVQYPIRNGFIIYFVFAYLSCYFAGEMYCKEAGEDADSENADIKDPEAGRAGSGRPYLSFIFTVTGFLVFIAFYRNHPGMQLRSVFHMTSAIMAAAFVFYFVLLNIEELKKPLHLLKKDRAEEEEKTALERRKSARYRWAAGVLVFEVLCYGFLLFGKPDFITGYSEEPEQNGEYINICEQLREKFGLEQEFLYRVKNPDESLNANYGLVLMQPALSNWTHMIAPGEQEGAAAWGYSIQFTRLLDSGGTVFSDALLGIRKVISSVPMDEYLYERVPDKDTVTVDMLNGEQTAYTTYQPRYSLPFSVVIDADKDTREAMEKALERKDTAALHNLVYKAMLESADTGMKNGDGISGQASEGGAQGDNEPAHWLIREGSVKGEDVSVDETRTKTSREVTIEAGIGGRSALYLMGSGGDREFANCTIEMIDADPAVDGVNEKGYITIPTIGDPGNIYYPAHFNNNAIYLGCFEDETVRIKVTMDTEKGEDFKIDLMSLSMDAMDELCGMYPPELDSRIAAGNRTLSFTVDTGDSAGDSAVMLLPLTYDKGWKIIRNGHRVRASSMAGLFTAVPLEAGENTVSMKFTPPGALAGTIISLVSLILSAVYMVIMRIKKDTLKVQAESAYGRISNVVAPVYIGVFAAVAVFVYVVPVVYGIFLLICDKA